MRTCCNTSAAVPAEDALDLTASAANRGCGVVSFSNRCSVQSPPRTTLVGTAGSGTIEPNSPPWPLPAVDGSPRNWNEVT